MQLIEGKSPNWFSGLMMALAINYRHKLTKGTILVFYNSLQDLTSYQLNKACQWIINNRGVDPKERYFPNVAEIRQEAEQYPRDEKLAIAAPEAEVEPDNPRDPKCSLRDYASRHPEDKFAQKIIALMDAEKNKRQERKTEFKKLTEVKNGKTR